MCNVERMITWAGKKKSCRIRRVRGMDSCIGKDTMANIMIESCRTQVSPEKPVEQCNMKSTVAGGLSTSDVSEGFHTLSDAMRCDTMRHDVPDPMYHQ